MNSLSSC